MYLNNDPIYAPQKKNSRLPSLMAVLASFLLTGALLAGCSGTGTMYTPDDYEEESDYAETGAASVAEDSSTSSTAEEFSSEQTPEGRRRRRHRRRNAAPEPPAPDEEPRRLRAELEGSGSDLYTAQAVSSYYHFTLDEVSFALPCSLSDFENAGWVLREPEAAIAGSAATSDSAQEQPLKIPSYSFEYAEAVPAGDPDGGRAIRLCLANFTENDLEASACTVCGISVSQDSGAALKTTFGTGIGDSLQELTSVFGTDPSCFTQTKYTDGSSTVRYHFANGLNENETIPVLAEAEDKSVAELLLVESAEDGDTIRSLSLFFFRLPE